jgi:hypothetical protein
MVCTNCGHDTNRILMSEDGQEICPNCSGLAQAGGAKIDGILTRNSWRVRRNQSRFEGDQVQPHVWDKNKRRLVVNPDFARLYPKQVKSFFSDDEMRKDGYSKLPEYSKKLKAKTSKAVAKDKAGVIFEGSTKEAVKKTLKKI